jgi:hypothetical protein
MNQLVPIVGDRTPAPAAAGKRASYPFRADQESEHPPRVCAPGLAR